MKSSNTQNFTSEVPLPKIPKSLAFSSNNPFANFKLENPKFENYSENIEEENFPDLNANLSLTIMNEKKNAYFNQKILDFNEKRKVKEFCCLSEELRGNSFSLHNIASKDKQKNSNYSKFKTYLTERSEEMPFTTDLNNNQINDTLDFLKKMQNYDLLEEEFLNGEKEEFERNDEYLKICAQAIRESEAKISKKIICSKSAVSINKGLFFEKYQGSFLF